VSRLVGRPHADANFPFSTGLVKCVTKFDGHGREKSADVIFGRSLITRRLISCIH